MLEARIPSQRVGINDPRTGLMAREWFLFFQRLSEVQFATDDAALAPSTNGGASGANTYVGDSNMVLTWLSLQ
jgi:hypothetical protein